MGQTSLHWAAKRGYSEIIWLLVKSGAKINVRDIMGKTPLMAALRTKQNNSIEALMKLKANPFIITKSGLNILDVSDIIYKKFIMKYIQVIY